MSSNVENSPLNDVFQNVNTWQDFADALPPSLIETFGNDEQFFLTMRLLDVNTPSNTPITHDAFKALVAVKRSDKGFVPLPGDEADQLLDSSLKSGLLLPMTTEGPLGSRFAPNPLFKEAIARFDKNEPKAE
ncbi:MAG: hypothetical protein M1484_04085 [Patescibacteria group bacterium]|nr:hypothetical protein [Patescibacteria group bacterium]MCL5432238.1 hypothetical protein [Patescibacteria group bacterium]